MASKGSVEFVQGQVKIGVQTEGGGNAGRYDVADEKQEKKEESDILQIISQLPEKYRSAIHLYYYEEYSVKEIAEILEKKETTIRSLLKRGREKLARMLPQQMKGDDGHAAGI